MIGLKLLTVAACLAGVILAQDYQEFRQAPLRIGTKAEEPKPTPVPILKQINSDRSGYYRKRCFAAVRNLCKLRSGDKTHSKFSPTGAGRPSELAAVGNGIAEAQQRPGGIGYGRPAPKAYPRPYRAP